MMKVTCNHCGAKNDLGRMFCSSCGKRMQITNADVDQAAAEKKSFKPLAVLQPLLLLVLFLAVAAVIIPYKPVVAPEGDRVAVRASVAAKYGRLVMAARARKAARETFDTAELNMFLKARQATATNQPALNLQLDGDRLVVLQPVRLAALKSVPLRFSRRLVCAPDGRTLSVRIGFFGHMPLPGPLKNLVSGPIASEFVLTPSEQTIEKQLTEILIRDGKLEIAVGP
jgi:hypothetical protein